MIAALLVAEPSCFCSDLISALNDNLALYLQIMIHKRRKG